MSDPLFRLIIPAFNPGIDAPAQTTMLGPLLIASAVDRLPDCEAEVIDENNCSHRPSWFRQRDGFCLDHETLQEIRPASAVGFCANWSSTIPRVFTLAEVYRADGILTVAGGHHVRSYPEEALRNGIDIVVLGTDEKTIAEVLEKYRELSQDPNFSWINSKEVLLEQHFSDIANIAFLNHLDQLQLTAGRSADCPSKIKPNFRLLRYGDLQVFPLQWRKGCSQKCEYCVAKDQPNSARAEDLLAYVRYCVDNFNAVKFFIIDDCFIGRSEKEIAELKLALQLLIDYQQKTEQQLEFNVQAPLAIVLDPELTDLMGRAGVKTVRIAYFPPIKQELLAQDRGGWLESALYCTELWRKYGFKVHGLFTFAYPYPTATGIDGDWLVILDQGDDNYLCPIVPLKDQEQQTKRFIRLAKLNQLSISLAVPTPGTKLRQRLKDEGRLLSNLDWQYYDGRFPLYLSPDYEPEELLPALKRIKRSFYNWRYFFRQGLRSIGCHFFPIRPLLMTEQLRFLAIEKIEETASYQLLLKDFKDSLFWAKDICFQDEIYRLRETTIKIMKEQS